jgi:chorismate synthase
MSQNTFGRYFRGTSFGESHGVGLGVVIDGCPSGVIFNETLLKKDLERRRPGQSSVTTSRNEEDQFEVLSGVFEGKTLGTPIALIIKNKDHKSDDYKDIKNQPRTGHADDVWKIKFAHTDHRGGGRSSGRETAARVLAGGVAKMLISQIVPGLKIKCFATQMGPYSLTQEEIKTEIQKSKTLLAEDFNQENILRFPTSAANLKATQQLLEEAKSQGESYGGTIGLYVEGVPAGLGEPVFSKLKSDLAQAMMSIGAVVGFELGLGCEFAKKTGTETHAQNQTTHFHSSIYGGIRGGISTGEPIWLQVFFKPTSSIMDTAKKGRHDPCIVPRAVAVVEAMGAWVLADHLLARKLDQI